MYDVIGDIHGYADLLRHCLFKLGYRERGGVFEHQSRQAVFLGDYVDRGPDSCESVKIVRNMTEAGTAYAIPGNHEYNLVCMFEYIAGQPLRPHTFKNLSQITETLLSYRGRESLFYRHLEWMKTLPLYLELDGLRFVHAAWIPEEIGFLQEHYPNRMTDSMLRASFVKKSKTFNAIQHLLSGIEIKLEPEYEFSDNDGYSRRAVRMRWWENPSGKSVKHLAARFGDKVPELQLPDSYTSQFKGYPSKAPILFLGHYCLTEEHAIKAGNVACLDYCIYKQQKLCVYRYEGERVLNPDHLHIFSY